MTATSRTLPRSRATSRDPSPARCASRAQASPLNLLAGAGSSAMVPAGTMYTGEPCGRPRRTVLPAGNGAGGRALRCGLSAVRRQARTVFHIDRIRVPSAPRTRPEIARGEAPGQGQNRRSELIPLCPRGPGRKEISRENPRENARDNPAGPQPPGTRVRGGSGPVPLPAPSLRAPPACEAPGLNPMSVRQPPSTSAPRRRARRACRGSVPVTPRFRIWRQSRVPRGTEPSSARQRARGGAPRTPGVSRHSASLRSPYRVAKSPSPSAMTRTASARLWSRSPARACGVTQAVN